MTEGPHRLSASHDYTGLFFEWIEEWSQFLEPCNWRTFHPVHVELEDDRIMGGVEVSIIVLGLGFRLRWNYARTEAVNETLRILDDHVRNHEKQEKAE